MDGTNDTGTKRIVKVGVSISFWFFTNDGLLDFVNNTVRRWTIYIISFVVN